MQTTILLVDDRPSNLIALEASISDMGYKLVSAQSGGDALRLVEQQDFALIILDVQMPEMDGFETARQIKKTDKGKDVPIIFITAIYTEDPFIKKGFEAGAVDYFGKPFDPDILRAKVNIYARLYEQTHLARERERKLAETQERLRAEKRLRVILETLSEGVIVADKNGKIIQSNQEARRIWGGTKFVHIENYDQYQGWWIETGERIGSQEWALARALTKGEVSHNEVIKIQAFDGTFKTILSSAAPLIGDNNLIEGAVVVLREINDKETENFLLQKNKPTG